MPTLKLRNGIYYANYSVNRRQIRVSLRTGDETKAQAQLDGLTGRLRREPEPPAYYPRRNDISWEAQVADGLSNSGSWLSSMYQRTKDRARSRDVLFLLSKDQLREIALRSDGRCELTHVPFNWDRPAEVLFPPFAPSLDRITPRGGYNAGNCRLICYAANMALADWGENVFRQLATAYLTKHK
jgi:hypothetical protein